MPVIPREFADHALEFYKDARPVQQSIRRYSEPKRRARGRSHSTVSCKLYSRNQNSNLARKPSAGSQEKHGHTADVHRLHLSEQVLPQGLVPIAPHRPNHRLHRRLRATLFSRCIFRVQSNPDEEGRRGEDSLYHALWGLLLHHNAFRVEERGCHVPAHDAKLPEEPNRENAQVYVDDIVVKSKKAETLIDDLRETFAALDEYQIKLIPKNCAFGVPQGELLGYLLSARGIEANR